MLRTINFAILIWPLLLTSSVVPMVPMSHVLRVRDTSSVAENKPDTAVKQNDTKPNIYSFTVTTDIKFRYATTVVSNRVANTADTAKEIAFTVTLPDSAFISGFLMVIKDKVYEAYVKEKEEARKDYQEAVDRGETAGHVELNPRDSNMFTVSVNVEPQSKVTFNLTYEQLLTRTLGLYENTINVNPGQIVKFLQIQVNIQESSNITILEVPDLKTSNEIDSSESKNKLAKIEQPTSTTARITWTPDVQQQQEISELGAKGQLIVRYDVDRVSNPNQILLDEGYFVHFYAPSDLKTLNKHVLFVLDISGSMGGRNIEQLREALLQILSDIGEGDYFSLLLFSDSVQFWTLNGTVGEASPTWYYDEVRSTPRPEIVIDEKFIIPANADSIEKAKAFAKTLNETGGTNIVAGLRKSIQIAQWGQKEYVKNAKPLIIFLTDGQPNVEMSDPEQIIKTVKTLNTDKYPIFSLAFGTGPDYDFLRKISLLNNGFARNIYVSSDTYLQMKNFYKQVASPLLANVSFDYIPGQVDNNTLTKPVFDNLFNGSELVVAGKLRDGVKTLGGNLTGTSADGYFCMVLPEGIHPLLKPVNRTKGHLEKLWAYLYIKELLDKDLISDEKNSTFKQEALKLSLEYGFVTPLTSLVVVKPNETSSTSAPRNPQKVADSSPIASYMQPISLRGPGTVLYSQAGPPPQLGHGLVGNTRQHLFKRKKIAVTVAPGSVYLKGHAGYSAHPLSTRIPYPPPPPMKTYAEPTASPQHSVQFNTEDFALDIMTPVLEEEPTLGTFSLNITDILWLKNTTEVTFPSSNNTYSVAQSDLPNTEFQPCLLPKNNNTLAHCRHLAHCVLPEIIASFEDFVPYGEQCVIDARFVGICCPEQSQKQSTSIPVSPTPAVPPTKVA